MSLSVAKERETVVVSLDRQLVISNQEELRQTILGELQRGTRQFELDFGRTGYVDSSGLGALVALSRRVKERGGELCIANLNNDLQTLLHLTKLDTLLVCRREPAD